MNKTQLMKKYGNERVLVIPKTFYKSALEACKNEQKALFNTITSHGWFELRHEAELSQNLYQVIPYVVLENKGKYFATKRIGGDERLVGQIGFLGGHVDLADRKVKDGRTNAESTIKTCLARELSEETSFRGSLKHVEYKTVFKDESSDVSKCHICILYVVPMTDKAATQLEIKETDNLEGQWYTMDELIALSEDGKMESWALIATDLLRGELNNDTSN